LSGPDDGLRDVDGLTDSAAAPMASSSEPDGSAPRKLTGASATPIGTVVTSCTMDGQISPQNVN
jgi:hypothetical protein